VAINSLITCTGNSGVSRFSSTGTSCLAPALVPAYTGALAGCPARRCRHPGGRTCRLGACGRPDAHSAGVSSTVQEILQRREPGSDIIVFGVVQGEDPWVASLLLPALRHRSRYIRIPGADARVGPQGLLQRNVDSGSGRQGAGGNDTAVAPEDVLGLLSGALPVRRRPVGSHHAP
jgi:hypothetical protein